jgi:hypothetical protein
MPEVEGGFCREEVTSQFNITTQTQPDGTTLVVAKAAATEKIMKIGLNKLIVDAWTLKGNVNETESPISERTITYCYDPDLGVVFLGQNEAPDLRNAALQPRSSRIPAANLKWTGAGRGRVAKGFWKEFWLDGVVGTMDFCAENYQILTTNRPYLHPWEMAVAVAHSAVDDPLDFVLSVDKYSENVDIILNPKDLRDPAYKLEYAASIAEAGGIVLLDASMIGGVLEKAWIKIAESQAKKQGLKLVAVGVTKKGIGKLGEFAARFSPGTIAQLKNGWRFVPRKLFKLGGDKGFDDILSKVVNGVEYFDILESKASSVATPTALSKTKAGLKQMSEPWVKDVIRRMLSAPDAEMQNLGRRMKVALDNNRITGKIVWSTISDGGGRPVHYSFRYYGPKIPNAVKARYVKLSVR